MCKQSRTISINQKKHILGSIYGGEENKMEEAYKKTCSTEKSATANELVNAIVEKRTKRYLTSAELFGDPRDAVICDHSSQEFPTNGTEFIVLNIEKNNYERCNYDRVSLKVKFKIPPTAERLSFDWKFVAKNSYERCYSCYCRCATYFRVDVVDSTMIQPIATCIKLEYGRTTDTMKGEVDLTPYRGEEIVIIFTFENAFDSCVDGMIFLDNLRIQECQCLVKYCAKSLVEHKTQLSPPAVKVEGEFVLRQEKSIWVTNLKTVPGTVVVEGCICKKIIYSALVDGVIVPNYIIYDDIPFQQIIDEWSKEPEAEYEVVEKKLWEITEQVMNFSTGEQGEEIAIGFLGKDLVEIWVNLPR